MPRKTAQAKLREAKRELAELHKIMSVQAEARRSDDEAHARETARLRQQLADNSDRLLPQKQLMLKELAYLVNATSRAVRTTMWSIAPMERRGGR